MGCGIKRSRVFQWMLIAAAMSLSGCATSDKSASITTATLPTVQGDFDQAELQAEATTDALSELAVSDTKDLPQVYDTFRKSVERMEAAGKRIIDHADGMYFSGPAYFVEAGKTVTSCEFPRLKASQNTQPADLGPYFDQIAQETWKLKRAYRAFESDITSLNHYLSHHTTPRAVDAMTPLFRKAQMDSVHLEGALERALAALERAKSAKMARQEAQSPLQR